MTQLAEHLGLSIADRVYSMHEVTTYSTTRPQVLMPGPAPRADDYCRIVGGVWICNRRKFHSGRCARVRWDLGGRVRAVWGTKATTARSTS